MPAHEERDALSLIEGVARGMDEPEDVLAGGDGVGALEVGEGGSDDFGKP